MAKTRGLIFEGRPFFGQSSPPAVFEDRSRFGNNGTLTNAPAWTKLPSGLWYMAFVAASSQKIAFGDIGKGRSLEFWLKPDSITEDIMEEIAATGISASGGTLSYAGWDNAFVNAVDTDTLAAIWQYIVITSTTDVVMSAFSIGLVDASYLDGGLALLRVHDREIDQGLMAQHYEAERHLFGV